MILEVPARLTYGSGWLSEGTNRTGLRLFLQAYGINLDEVYEIEFAKKWMEVQRYDINKDGHKYVGNDNEVARREPVIFKYRSGLTPIVH